MNIFYLDSDPRICAQYHYDKHVVKMILEYAQLLSTAHRILDGELYIDFDKRGYRLKRYRLNDGREDILYKSTHMNHPCAVWCRQSKENYEWLYQLWISLMEEYTYRYDKHHASERLKDILSSYPTNIVSDCFHEPPISIQEKNYSISVVDNYRQAYKTEKIHLYAYKKRNPPDWLE